MPVPDHQPPPPTEPHDVSAASSPCHSPNSLAWYEESTCKAEQGDAAGAVAVLSRAVEACWQASELEPERLWPAVEGSITLASALEAVGRQEQAREAWRDALTLVHQLQRCFPGHYGAALALVAAHEVRSRCEVGLAGVGEVSAAAQAVREYFPGADVVPGLVEKFPVPA